MSAGITYPVRAERVAVYDMVFDAEDRLVTFVAISRRSPEITQLIVDLLNAHHAQGVPA